MRARACVPGTALRCSRASRPVRRMYPQAIIQDRFRLARSVWSEYVSWAASLSTHPFSLFASWSPSPSPVRPPPTQACRARRDPI